MEAEIRRLNEALAQQLRSGKGQSGKVLSEAHTISSDPIPNIASGGNKKAEVSTHVKGVDEMTESEMKEELELLRQQTEVFQSDFFNERQDRQRVMGELDAVQKELTRTRRMIQQQDAYVHGEQRLPYHQNRLYSTSAPQPRYNRLSDRHPARYAVPPRHEPGRLIAHGRGGYVYNTAGNDVYIDGVEVDGSEPDSLGSDENGCQGNTLICPICERSFGEEKSYHIHISECMNA